MPGISPSDAIAHALRALDRAPAHAEAQARAVLAVLPDDARALYIVASARRRQGFAAEARLLLERILAVQPNSPAAQLELGLTLASLGESAAAIATLRHAVALQRALPVAWVALSAQLALAGDEAGAAAARAEHWHAAPALEGLRAATEAMRAQDYRQAAILLRRHLRHAPDDALAHRLYGETALLLGHGEDAEALLARAVSLAPADKDTRYAYAQVLLRQNRPHAALAEIEKIADGQPPSDAALALVMLACLILAGEYERAHGCAVALAARHAGEANFRLALGQVLRVLGRAPEAVTRFREALALRPGYGMPWWSLADLKTGAFSDADLTELRRQVENNALTASDHIHLHYALGAALEARQDWPASFAAYAEGARRQRATLRYDADANTASCAMAAERFDAAMLAPRRAPPLPADAPVPIFIVGLPRAGSTLVEQILARHSLVEATMELPCLSHIAGAIGRPGRRGTGPDYYDVLAAMPQAALAERGAEYLAAAARYRRTSKPYFIDKMPSNFQHAGLIRLILPQARIIDVRRRPMAAGFAVFKQLFARGQEFSYNLREIGRYYRDYTALMAHFDAVMPGFILRVSHEALVADPEGEIRLMLAALRLPFEAACLRWWETDRRITTHSSEQVRRPADASTIAQWRHYAEWLEELRAGLGGEANGW